MKKLIARIVKKGRNIGTLIALLTSSCANCEKEEVDAIFASIPDFETKNAGSDLKGWTYEKVISEKSRETYYYYHMASKKQGAPAFVLVHGMFLDGRTFLNFGSLASDFELISLELPHDSKYYSGHSPDFPKLLQDFLDTMSLERIYLGGVSLGGQIAMFYMEQDPKTQVDGLALISTDMVKSERELRKAKRRAKGVLKLTKDDDGKMLCLLNNLAERKKKNATPEDEEVMKIFSIKHPSFYREVLYTAINMTHPPRLDKIDVPTLIIHGDEDSTIPFKSAKHLVDHIPNSELEVISGGEHAMAYTRADEVVNLIKKRFVVTK
jgi:pimeloyl-ACP methyl ester carboxylesterase